ncbi:hypothetical protein A4A49_31088 [Nicotiana attenuata]|uniref:Endonuclease/exonuclease/phosphatase domain-containing protein n=1 Tax=Nicotiana attenuata TaxID=49451 RepID=A0A1J6I7H6_NICAT|nr:hypothetical protein A4A49_31088 [Nicotiana attenuata]
MTLTLTLLAKIERRIQVKVHCDIKEITINLRACLADIPEKYTVLFLSALQPPPSENEEQILLQPETDLAMSLPSHLYDEEPPLHPLTSHLAMSMTPGGSSTISTDIPMKILLWNCRGAANPNFIRNIKSILVWNNPSVLTLTETKLYEHENLKEELGFSGLLQARANGFSGGMVLLWKTDEVNVDPLVATNQELHATVQVSPSSPA